MVEYSAGRGRAMTVGAFVFPGRPNGKRLHLERFLENTVQYLLQGGKGATWWLKAENVPRPFAVAGTGKAARPARAKTPAADELPSSGLLLKREAPQANFYDVAGRRALVMGRENGGIDELWVHPFRVLRDLQAGFVSSGDSPFKFRGCKTCRP